MICNLGDPMSLRNPVFPVFIYLVTRCFLTTVSTVFVYRKLHMVIENKNLPSDMLWGNYLDPQWLNKKRFKLRSRYKVVWILVIAIWSIITVLWYLIINNNLNLTTLPRSNVSSHFTHILVSTLSLSLSLSLSLYLSHPQLFAQMHHFECRVMTHDSRIPWWQDETLLTHRYCSKRHPEWRVIHTNESRHRWGHRYDRVTSHLHMSHATHMHESCNKRRTESAHCLFLIDSAFLVQ